MKKYFLAFLMVAMLAIPSAAMAQRERGGYIGPNDNHVTVAEALKMPDEAKISLVGKIQKQLNRDRYQFSDSTGVIVLDINDKRWRGMTVRHDETVRIYGEIDRDNDGLVLDVKRIMKM